MNAPHRCGGGLYGGPPWPVLSHSISIHMIPFHSARLPRHARRARGRRGHGPHGGHMGGGDTLSCFSCQSASPYRGGRSHLSVTKVYRILGQYSTRICGQYGGIMGDMSLMLLKALKISVFLRFSPFYGVSSYYIAKKIFQTGE